MAALTTRAPAKVNLTLHVLGRRLDGYHELESLVAFAGVADLLTLTPGHDLSLSVNGPMAPASGPVDDNLVLTASRALAEREPGLQVGHFHLTKRLPAAAGIGGGSSDAAGALRLLARLNGLSLDHPAVVAAARATGADVPVCLHPAARMMAGAGERIGPPLKLPPLFAVLANPGVAVPTPQVFRALALEPGQATGRGPHPHIEGEGTPDAVLNLLGEGGNDMEPAAVALQPIVGEAIALLRGSEGCRLGRMSGSGATVFGLFDDCHAASRAARSLRGRQPAWWVKPTVLR